MDMNRSLRLAIFCGAYPLCVGTSVFLLWLPWRWSWLVAAGIYNLYAGVAFTIVGGLALGHAAWRYRRNPAEKLQFWTGLSLAIGLLLGNFPVAGAIFNAASALHSRYTISIHNLSKFPLTSARLEGGGVDIHFDTVPSGQLLERSFWVQTDGQLVFKGRQEVTNYNVIVEGYVTSGMGGHRAIVVESDHQIRVIEVIP